MEIKTDASVISIDRPDIVSDFFMIRFDDDRVSGVGAPNRYFGPYTLGPGNAISIGLLGATLMSAFIELESLKEHEYFMYLANVTGWSFQNNSLELQTLDENGNSVVLVYR